MGQRLFYATTLLSLSAWLGSATAGELSPLRIQELNFLHGIAFGEDEGTEVGSYVVHYADGKKEELAIIYGQQVRDWWAYPQEPQQTPRATVAWRGQNGATTAWGVSLQIFRFAWKNPGPDSVIESIDFVARPVDALPFLLAITAVTDATH